MPGGDLMEEIEFLDDYAKKAISKANRVKFEDLGFAKRNDPFMDMLNERMNAFAKRSTQGA